MMKWVDENGKELDPQPNTLEVFAMRMQYAELFLSSLDKNAPKSKAESIIEMLFEASARMHADYVKVLDDLQSKSIASDITIKFFKD